MTVANDILFRTLVCYRAVQSRHALKSLMRPDLFAALEALAKQIEKVLPAASTPGIQGAAADPRDEAYGVTRSSLSRLQHAARGWYGDNEDALRSLGDLTLGDDPAQDVLRLGLLSADLQKVKAPFPFVFPPDLLPARIKEIIAAHNAAGEETTSASEADRKLHQEQIALRAPAHALWKQGLDAWVQASVPGYEEQIALGRERRRRSRKPAAAASDKKDAKKAKEKDAKSEDETDAKKAEADKSAPESKPADA